MMSELIDNNQKARRERLKELIKMLHEGKDPQEVEDLFKEEFGHVSADEISRLESELVNEGELAVEEIQRLCDVHAKILGKSVADIHDEEDVPGHPLRVLADENKRLERLIAEEIEPFMEKDDEAALEALRKGVERLAEIKKHYTRKEQLFFPYLEKKGVTAPPRVMWGVHDEIREKIKRVQEALKTARSPLDVQEETKALLEQVKDMVFKEENIFIPLVRNKLNLINFIEIAEATKEVGYFLSPPEKDEFLIRGEEKKEEEPEKEKGTILLDAGSLTPETLSAMLNTLPFDLTFIDAEDKVRYFTQGKERLFERPKTILGRPVHLCHPPKSVHIVERILADFKNDKKASEAFRIKLGDKYVHIRYFAVRSPQGEYLGTLEVTQDIAPIQELRGEKRLLDEDS